MNRFNKWMAATYLPLIIYGIVWLFRYAYIGLILNETADNIEFNIWAFYFLVVLLYSLTMFYLGMLGVVDLFKEKDND